MDGIIRGTGIVTGRDRGFGRRDRLAGEAGTTRSLRQPVGIRVGRFARRQTRLRVRQRGVTVGSAPEDFPGRAVEVNRAAHGVTGGRTEWKGAGSNPKVASIDQTEARNGARASDVRHVLTL